MKRSYNNNHIDKSNYKKSRNKEVSFSEEWLTLKLEEKDNIKTYRSVNIIRSCSNDFQRDDNINNSTSSTLEKFNKLLSGYNIITHKEFEENFDSLCVSYLENDESENYKKYVDYKNKIINILKNFIEEKINELSEITNQVILHINKLKNDFKEKKSLNFEEIYDCNLYLKKIENEMKDAQLLCELTNNCEEWTFVNNLYLNTVIES